MIEKFGPKIKSPYSEITLFEFALFEELLYTFLVSQILHPICQVYVLCVMTYSFPREVD